MTHKDLRIVNTFEISIIEDRLINMLYFLESLDKKDIERELRILIEKTKEL